MNLYAVRQRGLNPRQQRTPGSGLDFHTKAEEKAARLPAAEATRSPLHPSHYSARLLQPQASLGTCLLRPHGLKFKHFV